MGERIFRMLLCLYPSEFRRRYGAELVDCFRSDWAAARENRGVGSLIVFWIQTLGDLVRATFRMRIRGCRVPQPSGGGRKSSASSSLLESLFQDLRFAARALRKRPGFTLVSVGIIGLGIAASTTLFSAVHGVLLRSLPYPEADRLVFVGSKYPEGTTVSGMSLPSLMDIMDQVGSVGEFAAARGRAEPAGDQPEYRYPAHGRSR